MEVTLPPPTTLAAHPQCKAALQTPAELEHADFLAIDDLLDFSNEDIGGSIEPSNASSCEVKAEPSASATFDGKLSSQACEFDSLCAPCDDLAELEWLSNFVEDCFSSSDAPACLGNLAAYIDLGDNAALAHRRISTSSDESFRTTSPVSVLETNAFSTEKQCPQTFSFSSPDVFVPGRARSKRCRTAVCFWNTRILCPEVSESLLETASTTYTARAGSSDSIMYNSFYDDEDDEEDEAHASDDADNAAPFSARLSPNKVVKNPSMKLKKSCCSNSKSSIKHPSRKSKKVKVDSPASLRKCLHCATQKTPQWRAGPMGPKTLCNACGVRYKSGRLCEEYRPAASPTFIERVHSNSHRKVLEMRRQRCEIGSGNGSQKLNSSSLNWGASDLSVGCAVAATDDDGRQYPASAVKAEKMNGQ